MLQPHKLWGVSIGAPGSVTLLDPSRDWWVEMCIRDRGIMEVAPLPAQNRVFTRYSLTEEPVLLAEAAE